MKLSSKTCLKCKKEKVLEDFPKDTRKTSSGRKATCKECANEYHRKRRAAKRNVEQFKRHGLKSTVDHTMPNAEMSDLERRRRMAAAEAIFFRD